MIQLTQETADNIAVECLRWHLEALEEILEPDKITLKDIEAIKHIMKYFGVL